MNAPLHEHADHDVHSVHAYGANGSSDAGAARAPHELLAALTANVETVLFGKHDVIETALMCLLTEGHLLIDDVPGVGKTLLAKALAASIDGSWRRVQFTPDLLPSDVIGVSILERDRHELRFRPGPLFAHFVLCDEINRASPKVQSALLEAMEERQVTVDGTTHRLSEPFMVIATQNPVEHEGTFPLPESQLDRFLARTSIGYPDRRAELAVLEHDGGERAVRDLAPVCTLADLRSLQAAARRIHVAGPLREYVVSLATLSRNHPALELGASPRASLALVRAARAQALLAGRTFAVPDDFRRAIGLVFAHRLVLTHDARRRGVSADDVVHELLEAVPVPVARARG